MLSVLVNILLPVFLIAGIAAWAQPRLKLDIQTVSKMAFYIFSPAMVLDALVNSEISGAEFGQIAAALLLTSLVLWAVGELAVHALGLDEATRAAFLVAVILANSGNYGIPVNFFAFGDAGVARAALYVTVNSLMRSSLGIYISARGTATSWRESLRRMLGVPVLYTTFIGLLINLMGWTLPAPILKAAHLLGQGLVPASLVMLGVQIANTVREKRDKPHIPALTALSIGRLVLAPIVAYFVCGLLGLPALSRDVFVLESATPTAVMSLVLASEFKSNEGFTALAILVTTLASLLTVALWLNYLLV